MDTTPNVRWLDDILPDRYDIQVIVLRLYAYICLYDGFTVSYLQDIAYNKYPFFQNRLKV